MTTLLTPRPRAAGTGRCLLLLLVLPGLLLGLVGCGNGAKAAGTDAVPPAETVRLELMVQDWNGWQPDEPISPTRTTVVVGESDTFTVGVMTGPSEIEVLEVTDDEVVFEVSGDLAGYDRDRDDGLEFTLVRGEELVLETPTLDAGTTVTITEA